MKFILVTASLFLLSQVSAQVSVTGKLVARDTEKALSRATVSVYDAKDTSLLVCRLSKSGGDFILRGIPLYTLCTIIVYDSGYAPYRKEFTLTENETNDMSTITLLPDSRPLEEMLVKAERPPVIVHNRTIKFGEESFKYLQGYLLGTKAGELFLRLPGIQFTPDGIITAGGEKLKKLFINNMELIYTLQ